MKQIPTPGILRRVSLPDARFPRLWKLEEKNFFFLKLPQTREPRLRTATDPRTICSSGISKIFALFDDDKSGSITLKNLKRVAKELGKILLDVLSLGAPLWTK